MGFLKDNWLIFNDEESLIEMLVQYVLNVAEKSIKEKGFFDIVVTGGGSVVGLYSKLSKVDLDWKKWNIYISDERFLPKGHKDRNDKMINEIWINNSEIPKANIHFIKIEVGLSKSRKEYEKEIKKVNKFDLVLLSMGEDGHIASLFPGRVYPKNQSVVIERYSPFYPSQRVSMSYNSLSNTNNMFKIILGKSKKRAVQLLMSNINLPVDVVSSHVEIVFICKNSMAC